jgi:DNA-binding MarR family transcriptional regulator
MNASVSQLVGRLRSQIRDEIQKELDARGIVGIDASYAEVFCSIAEYDAVTVTFIAERCFRTKSTISFLVDKLLKAGYVRKTRDAQDGRAVCIALTEKGRKVYEQFEEITGAINKRLMSGFKKKEKKKLLKLLSLAEDNLVETENRASSAG